ncbi:DUF2505 domain-containing protein [Gordonia soli]|uniref:DUF2505 domain-containing protein n=1 Tax=Gordonia soli NBRC 108243 TaxID=1223545 RepID=M0QPF2_9ACTN|nr:DUF2505 domain-containing protein [Gordonia soli]GAC70156.1 hypothetical protein GS4_32_01000 [Gordonia soli NBRC 108243]
MASNLRHQVTFPFSTQRLWELQSSEQYWRDLLEAINSSHGSVESFESAGDQVTVAVRQGIPEEKLPPLVTKVRPGDLHIPRRNVLTFADGRISGTISASVEGAPAKVEGTLVTEGDPATTTYTAEVDVSIPFVGGKIEKAILDQLVALLDSERDHTVEWEAANR